MSFATLMNTAVDVVRYTTTQDAIGSQARTATTVIESLPARIEGLSGYERTMSGSTGVAVTHRMYCSVQSIYEADEIHEGSTVYEVQWVNNVAEHHLEIGLLERRPNR